MENRQLKIFLTDSSMNKIIDLNEKSNNICGWMSNDILSNIDLLINKGQVEIGWRECCGKTDNTMKIMRLFVKAIGILKKEGYVISENRNKFNNGYATNNGGFWNSITYNFEKIEV